MQWKRWMLLLAFLSVAGFGCGGSTDEGAPPTEGESEQSAAASSPQMEPPAAAVAVFLVRCVSETMPRQPPCSHLQPELR